MKNCLTRGKWASDDDGDGDEGVKVELVLVLTVLRAVCQDLIEITLKRMDQDKDGRVSYEDFKQTVAQEPLLMEAFGECLPYNKAGLRFKETFLDEMPANRFYCVN